MPAFRTRLFAFSALAILAAACAQHGTRDGDRRAPRYPDAPRSDQVDVLHGVRVEDPFRPLEDPDAPEVRTWIEAENAITNRYLDGIEERKAIRERLTELWNYERYGIPSKKGGRYFWSYNDGLMNQNLIYVADTLDSEPRVLFDPNEFSEDGTVALASYAVNESGELAAYAISRSGSDWREIKVREIATGRDLDDHIEWAKFTGIAWNKAGTGFYYSRYDAPEGGDELEGVNYFQKLWFHRVGTPQSEDVLVYERPDEKEWGFGGSVTDDGRYLIIGVWKGTDERNRVYYLDLESEGAEVVRLLDDFDAAYDFVGNDGPVFWFRTDLDAARGRVIAVDTNAPERTNWKEVIPETDDALRGVSVVGDHFIAQYLKDARSVARVHALDGSHVRDVSMPGIGSAGGFGGDRDDPETFYSFSSYTAPSTIYRYNVKTGERELFREPALSFDSSKYVTEQVFFESKDGTRVPMFLTHKKGLERNGANPTHLYAYGGFNIPITPRFSVDTLVWLEMGGIYAVANLRGGGEYGREWHLAGTKGRKQNVFDDFISAAEWLIDNNYTSTDKLAISGGSNGGLLVGACITQRPDLFGAAVPRVGVLDMLRFHKFTIGWAWVSDYGSPDVKEEFDALYAYSPLHNVHDGTTYPPTLIVTADHDDRVVPAHSFKFAARLQEAQKGSDPILIRIETKAGHGAGKPVSKQIEEAADILGFMVEELGVD